MIRVSSLRNWDFSKASSNFFYDTWFHQKKKIKCFPKYSLRNYLKGSIRIFIQLLQGLASKTFSGHPCLNSINVWKFQPSFLPLRITTRLFQRIFHEYSQNFIQHLFQKFPNVCNNFSWRNCFKECYRLFFKKGSQAMFWEPFRLCFEGLFNCFQGFFHKLKNTRTHVFWRKRASRQRAI